jgi:ribosome-binding factor A
MKVSELLLRELRDPRLAGVHVTRVEMTGDLSRARLHYRTTPGQASPEDAAEGVRHAASFLRRELARTMRLRAVPELEFRLDELVDEGDRIERLLADLHGPRRDDDA